MTLNSRWIAFALIASLCIPIRAEPPQVATAPATVAISTSADHASRPAPHVAVSSAAHRPVSAPAVVGSINIVYPSEGFVLPPTQSEWIIGSVKPAKGSLRINGKSVKPYRTGGFIAYLPVTPGSFTFHCELELPSGSTEAFRHIRVSPPPQALPPGEPRIDETSLQPSEDLELRPGDWLVAQMKGTPDMTAQFQIAGLRKLPMARTNAALGIYEGTYQIQPQDALDRAEIRFSLKGTGWSQASAAAKGRLTVRTDPPPVVMVKSEGSAHVRIAPGEGFLLFPSFGTRLLAAGRQGDEIKVHLSPTLAGWIGASAVQQLPPGTPPPHATLGTLKTQSGPRQTTLSLGLTETVPFRIEVDPDLSRLRATLFYATDHTNWVIYDPADPYVRQVDWKQEDSQTITVTAEMAPGRRIWGYRPYWENGQFKIEIRQPPALPPQGSVFKNLNVIVDPGHMPSAPGAVGPTGFLEKDANLAIAKTFQALLSREGAHAILTRAGDDEVSLAERPRIAHEKKGDVFISVHNNNLADGADPFEYPHGYSVFYYQPMSLSLASAVHRAYQREVSLPDEFMRYGDLLVARTTEMPAVLVESAYMTFPEQEALLAEAAFQKKLARAMRDGLRDFLESERALQARRRGPQKR